MTLLTPLVAALLIGASHLCAATAQSRQKFILDTDIGSDVDDAYALALLASDPRAQLLGVTTAWGPTKERAQLAAKLLDVLGEKDVPVFAGRNTGSEISDQYLWAKDFRGPQIKQDSAGDFLHNQLTKSPGEITIIAIGPLTNLGDLLKAHPEDAAKIQNVVLMGGSVYVGYNNQSPPVQEYNIRMDPVAARTLFQSGAPIVMAGLEVTCMNHLDEARRKQIWAAGKPATDALAALTQLWGHPTPTLYDPFAVAWAMGDQFCESESDHVDIDDQGMTVLGKGAPNATVLVKPRSDDFLDWYVRQIVGSHN